MSALGRHPRRTPTTSGCHALEASDDGLTEVMVGGNRVTTPWDEIYGLDQELTKATVHLADRTIVIDWRYRWWRRLVKRIRKSAPALGPGLRDVPVEHAQIGEWLGIEPDGVLLWRHNWLARYAIEIILGAYFGGSLLLALREDGRVGTGLAVLLVGLALLVGRLSSDAARRRAREIRADVHGLSVRLGRRSLRLPWSAVTDVEGTSTEIKVTVGDEWFTWAAPTSSGGEALLRAIRHVTASRGIGMKLPSEAPLPDGALSRMSGEEPVIDRGLSLAREEPDDGRE